MTVLNQIYSTFAASVRSVGTACTLASIGIYLHRRNFIVGEGKRTLALISQQVTIPLLLFTKVVYCNQDWSHDPCPDIAHNLRDVWILLLWPAYVVVCGLLVGWMAARLSRTPEKQRKSVLAACAFGNSTGLPITLLTVVHANFPETTELGQVDPTLFLSVYLLLYPVLQWGVGGWLLAPDDTDEGEDDSDNEVDEAKTTTSKELEIAAMVSDAADDHDNSNTAATQIQASSSLRRHQHARRNSSSLHVLNNKQMANFYRHSRRGISETDASLYISNADLVAFGRQQTELEQGEVERNMMVAAMAPSTFHPTSASNDLATSYYLQTHVALHEAPQVARSERSFLLEHSDKDGSQSTTVGQEDAPSLQETLHQIVARCLQPPAVGAMLGLFVAATPLRGLFVDLIDRDDNAPLEWIFDALYTAGQAAVPINMIILGANLSASQLSMKQRQANENLLSNETMAAIVIGKMLIMPCIGILSAVFLKTFVWDIPAGIDASFYLVAMIVFITPTANNVMVMVELGGSGSKEGIAQVIAWQYAVAPILLSLTMSISVGVASEWS